MGWTEIAVGCALGAVVAFAAEPGPPWPPAYKLRPDEKARLTAADVVGPDGIVYPDWRHAGVPGGIPTVPERAKVEDFGGKADDDRDDAEAIERGAVAVAKAGGGALVLGKGTYRLDRPVVITDSGVVIRGQGAEATKLVFRYAAPKGGVGFFQPRPGDTIGPDTWLEVHAAPDGLQRIAVEAGGKVVAERAQHAHWGGTFSLRLAGDAVVRAVGAGDHALKAIAEWKGGRRAEATLAVKVDPQARRPEGKRRFPNDAAAIAFVGDSRSGPTWKLAKDGCRGDTEIALDAAPALKPGDALVLHAPATPRWNALVRNACKWGDYRRYGFQVEAVDGPRVRLNQPLRYDFPLIDGSTAQKIYPIRRCGVENLTLVQTEKLWTNGVYFCVGWECWARGVTVLKAGRFPLHATWGKWCEIRDCVADEAWYNGGGGTAYVGWQHSWDCLLDGVTTRKMRHAPCVQWASSGNVIRRGTFHGSDAQWHAGWTNENLFEQCTVDSDGSWGSYRYGAWASPPNDAAHGPNGPRNVVYNCDFRSPKSGLWMGGMNENWLILHNRFVVKAGPAVFARTCSFDHILRGNVFALADPKQPAIQLSTADCTGIEVIGNRIFGGNGQLVGGPGKPLVARDNAFAPFAPDPPRPQPEVPSIFEWQRAHAAR
ncbi:MAG TPA: endopolygalacturonase [Planctomycetota bacterium]|nr:endopolygalacturonase [Planctomycetota bacterium]